MRSEALAYFGIDKSVEEKDRKLHLTFSDESFRTRENAISNLFADIVLTELEKEETEVVLLNGGTFRGSGDWNGFITIKDLKEVLCVDDRLVQLKVRG